MKEQTAPKRIALFGATGTIGYNTLDIIRQHPKQFTVSVLSANRNTEKLIKIAKEFSPAIVVINEESCYQTLRDALPKDITVMAGASGLCDAAASEYDCMVSAIMGFDALAPTLSAIKQGRTIALANKECLVAAGQLFMDACATYGATLLPVDSEHNAIFQLWQGTQHNAPASVTLTASGGPFRVRPLHTLCDVMPKEAVAHPNWEMGAKISVDSATMMNKGLELIEAQHLFHLSPDQLHAIIHPQSIIHCIIHYPDGSSLAQMAQPDMRIPLAYALHYPKRLPLNVPSLSLDKVSPLTFESIDMARFPCLKLAYHAMHQGQNTPAMLNAANEVAVDMFLQGKLAYTDIAPLIERVLETSSVYPLNTLDDVFNIHHIITNYTKECART